MKSSDQTKVKSFPQTIRIAQKFRKEGKKIVLCHGAFDLLHPGHIQYLHSAKAYGDVLIVTVLADRFVKKGPGRPIFNQDLRTQVLSAIGVVDYVAIVNSDSPIEAIKKIQPNYYVIGSDHSEILSEEEEVIKMYGGKTVLTGGLVYSSTSLINEYLDVYPRKTKDFLDTFKTLYSDTYIFEQLKKVQNLRVMVIGDAIIDQYHYCRPLGKSSKEPIVVHKYLREESYAGGALATARHVAAICKNVTLLTLLGEKKSFDTFIQRHLPPGVHPKLFYDNTLETVIKRRYIDEDTNQKLFQVTYMRDTVISPKMERKIMTFLSDQLPQTDVVIVNDFGHGFLTKKLIKQICSRAKFIALNVQANSANYGFNVITKYPKADFVCIDEMELRLATHNRYSQLPALIKEVTKKLNCQMIVVTRGHYGSLSYSKKTGFISVPAFTQKVVDRVGAGDALFALTAPLAYMKADLRLISFIGNVAGALQVATVGNKYPIDSKELYTFVTRLLI